MSDCKLEPITKVAAKLGLTSENVYAYGPYKAKLPLSLMRKNPKGKLILVTATSPTPLGEGKTTMAIGLADAMAKLGKSVCAALREPSMGPTFGLKGGACGGGQAKIVPENEINLHFTGDFAAITQANNLIAACLDNHIYWGNELQIDPAKIVFKRALDLNERSLRNFNYLIKQPKSVENQQTYNVSGQFNITAASELMAIFGLASDFKDLRQRLDNILLAFNFNSEPVYLRSLKITDALLLILKDAFNPNLVQTAKHNPAIVHGGAFANIANGTNSFVSTKLACSLADYVVTEAGFGADLGLEKYFDLLAGPRQLKVDCVVLVTSLRALKYQAGLALKDTTKENLCALETGLANLKRHMQIIQNFQVPFVVCLNKFANDTETEINFLKAKLNEQGLTLAVADVFSQDSEGADDLAHKVIQKIVSEANVANAKQLFSENADLMTKLTCIAKQIYGAKDVSLSEEAEADLALIRQQGWESMSLCIAKTPSSFTDQANLLNAPTDFTLHVTSFSAYRGANFIVARCGKILTMPGLPKKPAACEMICSDAEINL